ncbi:hypothetical protein D3874_17665 [Oleomonas cavernae]|uniref:HD domain-containing protein n=1 Tax=Oleomonas cavernae TaxID=2320859 RepID=A0A418WF05_9PROT|nr:hypothetical protein [Oleomonas cavernae]RJF88597.1 hypothetical protein D3874_17665 [Oleomonas cavernae]
MSGVGTLAWARETGGRIDFKDRLALTRLAAVSLFAELPDMALYRLGLKRRFPAAVGFAALKAPDTAAARAAETLLGELTPPFMVNHSLRTYWFSRLIGLAAGLPFDDEILYLASLTHDLGFYGPYAAATPDAACFTIRSARCACDIAHQAGWDAARKHRVAEAVILNTNGHVPQAQGVEAHLMMRGVLIDATGMHAWRLNPAELSAVFERLPLLDQQEQLWPTFSAEADRQPRCRGHFAKRYLQFGLMVKLSPWNR